MKTTIMCKYPAQVVVFLYYKIITKNWMISGKHGGGGVFLNFVDSVVVVKDISLG